MLALRYTTNLDYAGNSDQYGNFISDEVTLEKNMKFPGQTFEGKSFVTDVSILL